MYAVEFQAVIENGLVRIPEKFKDLQGRKEVKFLIMYGDKEEDITTVVENKEKKMSSISIDTVGFKFDRDEAHER